MNDAACLALFDLRRRVLQLLILGFTLVGTHNAVYACPDSSFDEVRRLLEPDGSLMAQTGPTSATLEAYKGERLVWGGRIKHVDCGLTAEMVRIHVERRLQPTTTIPVGSVPSLSVLKPRTKTATLSAATPWSLELGVAGQWDTFAGRFGGSLEFAARYAGWGGRVELGGFAPRTETLGNFGDARFYSLHGLLLGEGCRRVGQDFRFCGAAGGGVERIEARSQGAGVFQQRTGRRWAPRIDLDASLAFVPSPWGGEFVVRGQWRPSPTPVLIMGIEEQTGLSRFALVLGIRGFLTLSLRNHMI